MPRKLDEPIVYIIPKNFLDSGYVLGGRVKTRNFVEGVLFALPVVGAYFLAWKYFGFEVSDTIAYCIIAAGGVFLAAANGVNGDSLFEFVHRVQSFRKNKRIAKYNPRVKLEVEPDYLMYEKGSIPKEKIMGLVNGWSEAFLGSDGPVSRDIDDEKLVVFFADDEGLVEKPDQLKTKSERKAEAKAARAAAKIQVKKERRYLRTLPRKERLSRKRAAKAEAKARALIEKRKCCAQEEVLKAQIRESIRRAEQVKRQAYYDRYENGVIDSRDLI